MVLDFRSDTVTQPTAAMRRAMFEAVVDDDVYGDDPTVNRLQELAAELTGKEAALFVASGTMGNQVSIMTHTQVGDEILLDRSAHIFKYEAGAFARLSGVTANLIETKAPCPTPDDIEAHLRAAGDPHFPVSRLLCLENPKTDGSVVGLPELKAAYDCAKAHGLSVHLDGARLFNAACALGVRPDEITQYCDSVMFCLSKGLCAPVGSMLCGSRAFVDRARRMRKIVGGGMRQAGVIAACGIVALEQMTGRVQEDHDNARYLGERLAELEDFSVDFAKLQTNMVFVKIRHPHFDHARFTDYMLAEGIKVYGFVDPLEYEYRFVTHHGIGRADIDRLVELIKAFIA